MNASVGLAAWNNGPGGLDHAAGQMPWRKGSATKKSSDCSLIGAFLEVSVELPPLRPLVSASLNTWQQPQPLHPMSREDLATKYQRGSVSRRISDVSNTSSLTSGQRCFLLSSPPGYYPLCWIVAEFPYFLQSFCIPEWSNTDLGAGDQVESSPAPCFHSSSCIVIIVCNRVGTIHKKT